MRVRRQLWTGGASFQLEPKQIVWIYALLWIIWQLFAEVILFEKYYSWRVGLIFLKWNWFKSNRVGKQILLSDNWRHIGCSQYPSSCAIWSCFVSGLGWNISVGKFWLDLFEAVLQRIFFLTESNIEYYLLFQNWPKQILNNIHILKTYLNNIRIFKNIQLYSDIVHK